MKLGCLKLGKIEPEEERRGKDKKIKVLHIEQGLGIR